MENLRGERFHRWWNGLQDLSSQHHGQHQENSKDGGPVLCSLSPPLLSFLLHQLKTKQKHIELSVVNLQESDSEITTEL